VRVRLTVAYDGSGFHGFAANDGVRTVGGTLAEALGRVLRLGGPIELACAGRTDRGVHAHGQVVSFDAPAGTDLDALARSINHLCGPAIAVREPQVVAPDFDARHSALARRYRYLVLNRPDPDPFLARSAWHIEPPLDVAAMTLACDPFIGEHDFSAFCRRPKRSDGVEVSLQRRVVEAAWHVEPDGLLRFEIEASAFCHQMVRSVVGTMVDVGRGRRRAGDVRGVLASRDRGKAGDLAPPHGLSLWLVRY
jgi:tRNA pseudouridine38-40 synthase